jgi:hypothetical protein
MKYFLKVKLARPFFSSLLLLGSAIFAASPALAATYYVDASNGNDRNAGTSPSDPWKTIAKLNSSLFSPGDTILLRRGQTWHECLSITSSGLPGQPITYSAYTAPSDLDSVLSRPLISGADNVTNWVAAGTSYIWKSSLTLSPSSVFFDDRRGFKKAELAALKQPTDWFYESTIKELYVFSIDEPSITFREVSAAVRPYLLHVIGKDDVTIDHIAFSRASMNSVGALNINDASHILLSDLTVAQNDGLSSIFIQGYKSSNSVINCIVTDTFAPDYDRGIGIVVDGPGGMHTISNNTIYGNTANGIKIGMHRGSSSNDISKNTVYSNGSSGISVNGASCSNNIIQYNRVYGNTLIVPDRYNIDLYLTGNDNIVRYNIVSGSTFLSLDSGGIRYDGDTIGSQSTGNRIYYNIIYDERTGVHILNYSDVAIYNNTIVNSFEYGIHVHGVLSRSNILKNNIVVQAGTYLVYFQDSSSNIIDYNCYYPDSTSAFRVNTSAFAFPAWMLYTAQDAHSINSSPQFVALDSHNFHLRPDSPCVDRGTDTIIKSDIDRTPIPQGSAVDIGAYELPEVRAPRNLIIKDPIRGNASLSMNKSQSTGKVLSANKLASPKDKRNNQ